MHLVREVRSEPLRFRLNARDYPVAVPVVLCFRIGPVTEGQPDKRPVASDFDFVLRHDFLRFASWLGSRGQNFPRTYFTNNAFTVGLIITIKVNTPRIVPSGMTKAQLQPAMIRMYR